jgi:hypothetical protein
VSSPDSGPLNVRELLIASAAPDDAGFSWVCEGCGVKAARIYTEEEDATTELDEHRTAAHHSHFVHDGTVIHPPMAYIVQTVVIDETSS